MESLVYYHHPDDERYSIDFVNTDRSQIESRISEYDTETRTKVETYELDQTVHVIYTAGGIDGPADELEYDFDEEFGKMNPADRLIASAYLDVFEGVMEEKEMEEAEKLKAYKRVELGAVPEALKRVRWGEAIPVTAGTLLSNLILRHALPNANHRTAFGLVELYLECGDPQFRMPSMATDEFDWKDWVDPYIVDSKRLLTVRRNTVRFRMLEKAGCEIVMRKGGIGIPLSEYDLTMGYRDALRKYAERHEERSIEFVHRLLARAEAEESVNTTGIDKSAFAQRLKNTSF